MKLADDNQVEIDNEPPNASKPRFAFGKNWADFLTTLTDARIEAAKQSLQKLLNVTDLEGKRFLDAGSGSGLFSLAANRLGADVVSFDLDQDSVACTDYLKNNFSDKSRNWTVLQASLTDSEFLTKLGDFDVIYCWGVAHHTGNMWQVIDNLQSQVKSNGAIVLAIYNDQFYVSRGWSIIKRTYQKLPKFLRPVFVSLIGAILFMNRFLVTLIACGLRLVALRNPLEPFANWASETQARGMHTWYDLVDWVGGWPFEVARPEEVFRFMRDRGFVLQEMTTSSGHGCNEFMMIKK